MNNERKKKGKENKGDEKKQKQNTYTFGGESNLSFENICPVQDTTINYKKIKYHEKFILYINYKKRADIKRWGNNAQCMRNKTLVVEIEFTKTPLCMILEGCQTYRISQKYKVMLIESYFHSQ